MLNTLNQTMYENVVAPSSQPAVLCFFKNTVLHNQAALFTEQLSTHYSSLPFYRVPEEEHEFFFGKFHFLGTPIFIFLKQGIERGRLLGSVSQERLRVFIDGHLHAQAEEMAEHTKQGGVAITHGLYLLLS